MKRVLAILSAAAFLGGCATPFGAPDTRAMGAGGSLPEHRIDWVSTAAGYEPDPFRLYYGAGE